MLGYSPLTGNTYPHRDIIKRMGGRWNAASKCWMVPHTRHDETLEAIRANGGAIQADLSDASKWTCIECGAIDYNEMKAALASLGGKSFWKDDETFHYVPSAQAGAAIVVFRRLALDCFRSMYGTSDRDEDWHMARMDSAFQAAVRKCPAMDGVARLKAMVAAFYRSNDESEGREGRMSRAELEARAEDMDYHLTRDEALSE